MWNVKFDCKNCSYARFPFPQLNMHGIIVIFSKALDIFQNYSVQVSHVPNLNHAFELYFIIHRLTKRTANFIVEFCSKIKAIQIKMKFVSIMLFMLYLLNKTCQSELF